MSKRTACKIRNFSIRKTLWNAGTLFFESYYDITKKTLVPLRETEARACFLDKNF